jgi:hypothetical protein
MRSALVVAAVLIVAPMTIASNRIDSGCRGDCVVNGNARDGRECFSDAEVETVDQIVPVMLANGTSCPEQQPIVGARVTRATNGCNRVDVFFCQTAVAGVAEGLRVDRDAAECFSAAEASDLPRVVRTLERNGATCPHAAPILTGIKFQKVGDCWRAPALYCDARPRDEVTGKHEPRR